MWIASCFLLQIVGLGSDMVCETTKIWKKTHFSEVAKRAHKYMHFPDLLKMCYVKKTQKNHNDWICKPNR